MIGNKNSQREIQAAVHGIGVGNRVFNQAKLFFSWIVAFGVFQTSIRVV